MPWGAWCLGDAEEEEGRVKPALTAFAVAAVAAVVVAVFVGALIASVAGDVSRVVGR